MWPVEGRLPSERGSAIVVQLLRHTQGWHDVAISIRVHAGRQREGIAQIVWVVGIKAIHRVVVLLLY